MTYLKKGIFSVEALSKVFLILKEPLKNKLTSGSVDNRMFHVKHFLYQLCLL